MVLTLVGFKVIKLCLFPLFVSEMFESGLDFSNVNINDFILCVKRLNEILQKAGSDARTAVRQRNFNSAYSKSLFNSQRFNPRVCSSMHSFTDEDTQIDICIRKKHFYVSVCGAWRPDPKALNQVLALDNLNFDMQFDFSEVRSLVSHVGSFTFYGGDDFPVDDIGFKRISRVWCKILLMYFSHKDVLLNNVQ